MRIPKDTVGAKIIADCVSDVSTQTALEIHYRKPGETTSSTWVGTLGTDAITVDGVTYEANTYMYYITQSGDLDTVGEWKLQGYVELSGGFEGFGKDGINSAWQILKVSETL